MTDTKQPEALRLAHIFDCPLPPEWTDMVAAAAELRRQHAENTALQQGYDAARLEIEALRRDLENARHNLRVSQTSFRRAADERDLLIGQQEGVGDYPALPTAPHKIGDINLWPASQMRAYADATCAMRAQVAPAAVAGPEPERSKPRRFLSWACPVCCASVETTP